MLYVTISLCVIVCTFFIGRFFAAKTRLVEKDNDEAIIRKLSASPMNIELRRLREQNGVMRNLLIDMLENEGSVAPASTVTADDQARAMKARIERRREIFGEAVFALQQGGNNKSTARNFKIDG